jgi:cell fate regulator YaaT (PSP1 superfamily)
MGCGSCSSGTCGSSPAGCKNNGHCKSGGCNKLNVFDWLGNMDVPSYMAKFNIVEVRFKGSRKMFFRNSMNLDLTTGDAVVVEMDTGYDLGHISLSGELVRLHLKKYNLHEDDDSIKKILRIAGPRDIEKWQEAKALEKTTLPRARQHAISLGLKMKLSDVEYQGDKRKVTFYYTAEERVDFRELIKRFAEEFKVKIEMKQIGYRQEASRLGGIGSCGRELCCSTWLTDFKLVNTSAARYQNLSLNPLKLSGQCGRLKCCLNYELDTYMEALRDFPENDNVVLLTEVGTARVQKTDILKRVMWFSYEGPDASNWRMVNVDRVNEILAMNKKGVKPAELSEIVIAPRVKDEVLDYKDVVGQDSITRMSDNSNRKRKKKKRKPGGPPAAAGQGPRPPRPVVKK